MSKKKAEPEAAVEAAVEEAALDAETAELDGDIVTTATDPGGPKPAGEEQPQVRVGYTVALLGDGNFHFEILGEDKGLVELLGIHQYASTQVEKIRQDATMTGDRLSHELGAVLNILNQKLDALLQAGGAKKKSPNDL